MCKGLSEYMHASDVSDQIRATSYIRKEKNMEVAYDSLMDLILAWEKRIEEIARFFMHLMLA